MVNRKLGVGLIGFYGSRKNSKNVPKQQGRYSFGRSYRGINENGKRNRKKMSMLSKAIDRYIAKKLKKYGTRGAIIWFIDQIVKLTPTKKDDEMFIKIRQLIQEYK